MSSPQEQYAEAVRTSQQAVVGAVESWSKSMQSALGQPQSSPTTEADLNQVMDQVFDFMEKMLEVQREFAKNLASTAVAAGQAGSLQAESATEAPPQSRASQA